MMNLTPDAVKTLQNSDSNAVQSSNFNPIMQVVNVKRVQGSGGSIENERYRIMLSDGSYFIQGMTATQINHLIHERKIIENAVIKIKEYLINRVQNKIVVIVLNVDILNNPMQKIGTPVEGNFTDLVKNPHQQQNQGMYNQQPMRQAPIRNPEQSMYGGSAAPQSQAANPYSQSNRYNNAPVSSRPIVRSHDSSNVPITPITGLNLYNNKWVLKARVISKSDIRTWSNQRGEGTLFSIELVDQSKYDIKATFFKEAVDKFFPLIQMGNVYTFSGGRLKAANMQYNKCKSGYEITFDVNSNIVQVAQDKSISEGVFDFTKISAIEATEPNSTVDLIAIVKSASAVSTVMSRKSGQELFKADLVAFDETGTEVNITLWGERAKTAQSDFVNYPVVAFKHLRVSDFAGRSLNLSGSSTILINPSIMEAQQLKNWWSQVGGSSGILSLRSISSVLSSSGNNVNESLESRSLIEKIKNEQLGYQEKPDYISVKGFLTFLKKDKEGGPWYTACANPNEPCKNRPKVTSTVDGKWHCDRCSHTYDNCMRRFIFSATLADSSSTTWVSIFDEQAQILLGGNVTADQMHQECFGDNYDPDRFDCYFAKVTHTEWIAKLKVKQEMMGDESRIKASLLALSPIDYVKESKELIAALDAL